MKSEEEDDSVWLCEVLESIGVNDEHRRNWQQAGITDEILLSVESLIASSNYEIEATVTESQTGGCEETSEKDYIICKFPDIFENIITFYSMGSTCEGTFTPDERKDFDFIECQEWLSVIEDIAKAEKNKFTLLIVREPKTPAGYVKLQLVKENKPLSSTDWPSVKDMFPNMSHCFKTDILKRLVLCDSLLEDDVEKRLTRRKNRPAFKKNVYGVPVDTVISYRCKTWPAMANEWLTRSRLNNWPSKDMIQDLKSLGFFVVRKGHPNSSEKDLEWRICLTLQERNLMYNLTDVQHKCYVFLKIINRKIIKSKCITSYHWKTCLFYMIERNKEVIWEKRLLFHCVKLCIKQMLTWMKIGVCPNYFISAENLFDGRLTNNQQRTSCEKKLVGLLDNVFSFLHSISSNDICKYVKARNDIQSFQCLQTKSEKAYKESVYRAKTSSLCIAHAVVNQSILAYYIRPTNDVYSKFINFLWLLNVRIHNISTIFEHTEQEVKSAQALLLPCIYTCLASTISAFAFNITQFDTRYILLFRSLSYLFMNGDLTSRLKLISVLLAAELYADCEWHLDQLEKKIDFKCIPSFCVCRNIVSDSVVLSQNDLNSSTVSTCLSFLPTELQIIPNALKYEMFRFIVTSMDEIYDTNRAFHWHYMAVVDGNIYFFLLKYLLNKKLRKVKECKKAKNNIINLLHGENVRHPDVAYNLLASIFFSEFNTHEALLCITRSWETIDALDICTEESKRIQYLYNAAKIHALVILYKTWFARIPSDVYFCFHCLSKSETRLQQCSRCKVSTYCDKQCQRKNWKIHKKTCKMARKHHILFSTSVQPFAFH